MTGRLQGAGGLSTPRGNKTPTSLRTFAPSLPTLFFSLPPSWVFRLTGPTLPMQAEFYGELGDGADRLEIPWSSPDQTSNQYYDLKARPELLSQIVEASANPSLSRFLAAINAPETMFATAKCHTWLTEDFSSMERTGFPAARIKFASYLDLVFSQPVLNFQSEHYEQLARRIVQQLSPSPVPARAELCLRHCYYHAQQAWGYYLTIFLYGYGSDEGVAGRHWATALEALGEALTRLSGVLRQALRQIGSTASKA